MGNDGYVHWATQSAQGSANTADGQRVYVTDHGFTVADLTRTRRPAIGGKAFPEDAYKAGTSGGLTFSLEVPGENIGYLLYFLSGDVAVTDDTGPIGGAQTSGTGNVDTYTFKMVADDFTLPWFTSIVSTEDVIIGQLADCAMLSGRFMFNAGDSVQATFAAAGITPSWGTGPSTPDDDASPILVASNSNALFELADAAIEANQVAIDFANVAADVMEEMKIGSPYRRGITKLARACNVTIRRWTNEAAFKATYFGGGTAWSASPYTAKLEVRGASGTNIASSAPAEPYSLEFEAGEVAFLGCGAPQRAQSITFMEMTGSVVIPSAGEEFSFILGSAADVDYTAVPS